MKLKNGISITEHDFVNDTLVFQKSIAMSLIDLQLEEENDLLFENRPTDLPVKVNGFFTTYRETNSKLKHKLAFYIINDEAWLSLNGDVKKFDCSDLKVVEDTSAAFKFSISLKNKTHTHSINRGIFDNFFVSHWFNSDEKLPIALFVNVLCNEQLRCKYSEKLINGTFNLTEFVFGSERVYSSLS